MPLHRRHVVLSVWPIALGGVLGVTHLWPALMGGPSYASQSPASWLSLAALTLSAVAFFVAYVRGWSVLTLPTGDAGPYRTPGCVRLQKIAGLGAWSLLLGWVLLSWWMTVRVGPVALSHYELLRTILSRPPVMGACVFGLAAFGLYLSQGLAASFRAWGLGSKPESSLLVEVGCTLPAIVIVLLGINVLSHFATGRAYWTPSAPLVGQVIDGAGGEGR